MFEYVVQALQKEGRGNMPCSDLQIEGLDAELLQKLQVIWWGRGAVVMDS